MNRAVFKLLADYVLRTLGVWPLAATVYVMQVTAFWAGERERIPVVGAVIGAIAFFATFDAPYTVMRTLPLRGRDVALTRWWVGIGWPALISATCVGIAVCVNLIGYAWPVPPPSQILWTALASFATLGVLSVLPLPVLSPARSNFGRFVLVWGVLLLGALYGFPAQLLPDWLAVVLCLGGVAVAVTSFMRASLGKVVRLPTPSTLRWRRGWQPRTKPVRAPRVHGWGVIVAHISKTTALLTVISVALATVLRWRFPALDAHSGFASVLPTLFVSATGITGSLLARRWLGAIRALQVLPIRDNTLAFITCALLVVPAVIASLVATGLNHIVPGWGVNVPLFMFSLFAIVPALFVPWQRMETSSGVTTSVQQWSPFFQIALWPIWTGAFASIALTKLMPAWIDWLAVAVILVFATMGYLAVRARIRAGLGLEGADGPEAAR